MRIIIRTDASQQIGFGHVMRCLTLAQVLKDNGANVEFICRRHNGNLVKKIHLSGFYVYELEVFEESEVDTKLVHSHWLSTTQQQDADDCIDILKSSQIDWLIVDHYSLDEDWQYKLKPYCEKLMVIDDLADRKHQCDILLDQTFGRQQEDYSTLTPKGCTLLLGSQYALLRPEFTKWREYSLERRNKTKFKQLLVNMGGVDVDNVTESILDELMRVCSSLNDINIIVIMGGSAPHLESIKSKANILSCKTDVKVDVGNMAEIMANTDIAIGAAGSTTWERCCLGLPTIQIITAKNQQFLAETLMQQNIVKLVKETKDTTCLLERSIEWMKDAGLAASQVCDGKGRYRVFNRMSDQTMNLNDLGKVELCNYINLDMDDQIFVLKMRNHPKIKKWMHNQVNILQKDHFGFIENLKSSANKRYFLIKQKSDIIGSINFSKINLNNSVEFGIYANPFLQFKGSGALLELVASKYAFNKLGVKKIKLEVFSRNKRAINFYNKCGFKILCTKNKSHNDILYMQKESILGGF